MTIIHACDLHTAHAIHNIIVPLLSFVLDDHNHMEYGTFHKKLNNVGRSSGGRRAVVGRSSGGHQVTDR